MLRLLFGGQGLSPQPRAQVKTVTVCVRLPQSAEQKYACMIDGCRVMVPLYYHLTVMLCVFINMAILR